MSVIILFLSYACLSLAAFFFYLGNFRNPKIATHFRILLKEVTKSVERDISQWKNFDWRFDELDRIIEETYPKMVWQFWRPLESFYDRDYLLGDKKDNN